ncbi:hypothetical protein ACC696_36650 [Rhizobium ruizarguesonis]|uniref:Uncharacterized protein n=1 Tax=Rhizobium ruizarguesonis TaxID=2081791 RepID=A0ABY1X7E6_9HYPH|nr:hypothetical protein [Rhizobium ruizarguesonis]TAX81147.1 hypothetical protein ELH98_08745 [Rhizobium ruizarguesonis]TBE22882.1 hypothetical protein ELH08_08235 [Rhizobium ruizarguesonis]
MQNELDIQATKSMSVVTQAPANPCVPVRIIVDPNHWEASLVKKAVEDVQSAAFAKFAALYRSRWRGLYNERVAHLVRKHALPVWRSPAPTERHSPDYSKRPSRPRGEQ